MKIRILILKLGLLVFFLTRISNVKNILNISMLSYILHYKKLGQVSFDTLHQMLKLEWKFKRC